MVAWHGNYAPYKYDLRRFNAIGSISYDHPDPSIFLVLQSPSDTPGVDTHRLRDLPAALARRREHVPPAVVPSQCRERVHGPVHGAYDAKAEGFVPGGASLHNCMSGHGPDAETFEKAVARATRRSPHKSATRWPSCSRRRTLIKPTRFALETAQLQAHYYECWQGLKKHFNPEQR